MNTELLKQHVLSYKKWLKSNAEQARQEQQEKNDLSLEYRSYSKEHILEMKEDDIYSYIAPLWAMLIWGNKQYIIDKLISDNGLEILKKQIALFLI